MADVQIPEKSTCLHKVTVFHYGGVATSGLGKSGAKTNPHFKVKKSCLSPSLVLFSSLSLGAAAVVVPCWKNQDRPAPKHNQQDQLMLCFVAGFVACLWSMLFSPSRPWLIKHFLFSINRTWETWTSLVRGACLRAAGRTVPLKPALEKSWSEGRPLRLPNRWNYCM